MGKLSALAALALLVSCSPEIPRCMEGLPRTPDESKKVISEIQKELGEKTRVEQIEDVFFMALDDTSRSFERCRGTIECMTRHLYNGFFTRKPQKPIRVYLFRGKTSYESYYRETYGGTPSTPFGFYMSSERKIVMNIGTGTGTLAHELVHPLLGEDFPDVPDWFNEGFASLYEQSISRGGRMFGLVNWRLPILQEELAKRKDGVLDRLLRTGDEFYTKQSGVNYAVARYLCFYLQEKKLLEAFYKRFRENVEKDPTGRQSLEKVTGRSVGDLEKEWRVWVKPLRFRR